MTFLSPGHSRQLEKRAEPPVSSPRRGGERMCLTQPHAVKARRIAGSDQPGALEPGKRRVEQTAIFDFGRNWHLQPRRMPGTEDAALVAAAKEARVALQRKLAHCPGPALHECSANVNAGPVRERSGHHRAGGKSAHFTCFVQVLAPERSEGIRQPEHP